MSYKLIIQGIDEPILMRQSQATSLNITNRTFFARVTSSLCGKAESPLENFAFYEDEKEVKFNKLSLVILSPLDLPFKNATLLKNLFLRIENNIKFNDSLQIKVNELQLLLNEAFEVSQSKLHCEYDFAVEFDVKKYLKTFGFSSEIDEGSSLLDNLTNFLDFIADVAPNKLLYFVNIASFLDKDDYIQFCETIFSLKLTALIVNSGMFQFKSQHHANYVIDQHFLLHRN